MDGLRKRKKITDVEFQTSIATITERVENNSKTSNFFFAEVNNTIVIASAYLIPEFNLSADDALHFATAIFYRCKGFVLDDKSFKNNLRDAHDRIAIFDLRNSDDIELLTSLCELD